MTNPQSEVKCCECESPKLCDSPCGRPFPHCDSCLLPIHPKESPVSQSVEGWHKFEENLVSVIYSNGVDEMISVPKTLISYLLSTLVKEMEGLKKEIIIGDDSETESLKNGFNAGISAAVEVVKKMV